MKAVRKAGMKVAAMLLCFAALFFSETLQLSAAESYGDKADEILNAVCESAGVKSARKLIDLYAEDPSVGGEWVVISLRNMGEPFPWAAYREALSGYAASQDYANPVTGLREALTLLAVGGEGSFTESAVDRFTDESRVYTLIYALLLMENGAGSENWTKASLREALLLKRCSDGGWSVTGGSADTDVTAMALQALTPGAAEDPETAEAVDTALSLLSQKQQESGGFLSMGAENPESVSQVIIALAGLGIDPLTDERFIKNGNTLLDALSAYGTEGGGYSHTQGGAVNAMSTAQALEAYVSLSLLKSGGGSFFVFGPLSEEQTGKGITDIPLKLLASAAVFLMALSFCLFLLLIRKKRVTACVLPAGLALILILALNFVKVQSVRSYYGESIAVQGAQISTTITIRCDSVKGRESWIPEDGVMLPGTEILISEGGTAYEQLSLAARQCGLRLSVEGGSYIVSINNLAELEFGSLSGWVFSVNGEMSDRGLRETELSAGDQVEWIYSLDMGRGEAGE